MRNWAWSTREEYRGPWNRTGGGGAFAKRVAVSGKASAQDTLMTRFDRVCNFVQLLPLAVAEQNDRLTGFKIAPHESFEISRLPLVGVRDEARADPNGVTKTSIPRLETLP